MKSQKILDSDIKSMKIASLPSKPTASLSFGGGGYTAAQVKDAFDKLPLYLVNKFNVLIEDILTFGEEGLAGAILTGIKDGHTLAGLLSDIGEGEAAEYLAVGEETLADFKRRIDTEMAQILSKLEQIYAALAITED